MRRTILVVILAVFVAGAWYWASPYFAVAGLRNALIRSDTTELGERVDFPRLRENVKMQMSAFMMANMKEKLTDNPFAALALAFATTLTDVLVESMITPAGMLTLMAAKTEGASETSGFALMTSSEVSIRRDGLDGFDALPAKDGDKTPSFRFKREGYEWRLVGLHMPKELLEASTSNAGESRAATTPQMPKWLLTERKDPMDDSVSVILYRDADEEVGSGLSSVRPALVFRCDALQLEAYVLVRGSVDYNYETKLSAVRLRFDEGKVNLEGWQASTNRESLFAPEPEAFLRAFRGSGVLFFEWSRYDKTTRVAKFSKGDLDVQVGKFGAACGIDL